MFKRVCAAMISAVLGAAAAQAGNDTSSGYSIKKIVVDNSRYAGCMVQIQPGPETVFSDCRAAFVSFGCDGTVGVTKSTANQLLAQAQLAAVTGRTVTLRISEPTDAATPRGYCIADRLDVEL